MHELTNGTEYAILRDSLRGRLVEAIGRFAIGRADGAIGRSQSELWAIGERLKVKG